MWVSVLALVACGRDVVEREEAAARATSAEVDEDLTVEVSGGIVVGVEPADEEAGRPARLRLRATSFDLQVGLQDEGCAARAVDVTVENVAEGAAWSWQAWRGGLSSAAQAERQCCGALLAPPQAREHPDWTPLGPASDFQPGRLAADAETCEGVAAAGTDMAQRATSRCWRLRVHPATDAAQVGNTAELAVPAPATRACADFGTREGGPARQAPFILSLRGAWRPPATSLPDGEAGVRFAVFGNHAGVGSVRRRLVEAVSARVATDELRFALVVGDLGASGRTSELDAAVEDLSVLPMPWFATAGERDVSGADPDELVARLGPLTEVFDVYSAEGGAVAFRVVLLDSAEGGLSRSSFRKLDAWLEDREAPDVRLVATHTPPFEPHGLRGKAFKSRTEAARFLAALHRGGVTDAFTAHLAIFERQSVGSVTLWHAGGGGAPMESLDGDRHHFLIVTVNSSGAISVERVDLQ